MVLDVVTPGCEWVLDGEGRATIKWDGTACLVQDGRLFKRYDRKPTKAARKRHKAALRRGETLQPYAIEDLKPAPEGFEPCRPLQEPDLITGHWPGWVPIDLYEPSDRWHREALEDRGPLPDGTYELVGPKIQANPYGLERHLLIPHGGLEEDYAVDRTFAGIRAFLDDWGHEGIVFHHPDGRMAKIRRKDFFFDWPLPGTLTATDEPIR
jgi:hypothetical protein